jgi:hypothetical protein
MYMLGEGGGLDVQPCSSEFLMIRKKKISIFRGGKTSEEKYCRSE